MTVILQKREKLYHPRFITCALEDNELANYWTSSGPYDELFYYIRHNLDDVRNDLALMISHEDAMILELKIDSTPEEAIQQIKDKPYALRLMGKLGEKPKYTGKILHKSLIKSL